MNFMTRVLVFACGSTVLVAIGGMRLAYAEPKLNVPRIIATSPFNEAKDVDPAIKEVAVTFDRDMDSSFTWNGDGPEFPFLPECKVFWRDRRTCVLPVILEPGRKYQIGLNIFSPNDSAFRSVEGVRLPSTTIYFATEGSPDENAELSKGYPKLPAIKPNALSVMEGVGWDSFLLGATRDELVGAYGEPDHSPQKNWMRWASIFSVDCTLDHDGRVHEVRFNEEFPLPLASGVKIGSSELDVLLAYGKPDSVVQQPAAKMFVYYRYGILVWLMKDRVFNFTVIKKREGSPRSRK